MNWDKAIWTADEVLAGVPNIAVSTDLQHITGILQKPMPDRNYQQSWENWPSVEGSGYFFLTNSYNPTAYWFVKIDDLDTFMMMGKGDSALLPFKHRVCYASTAEPYYQYITFLFTKGV